MQLDSSVALQVRGLTRTYRGRVAVRDLDLNVHAGDVYGFLGPNGAGKTTAIRCMLGLIRPDRGEMAIFGEVAHPARLQHVGAMVETPAFHVWMDGRENLLTAAAYASIPGSSVKREVDRVLDRVGLLERSKDKVGGYSLGMRQRLAIARSLLGGPKLLILDEPTNGLDPRGMREVRDLIRSLALADQITVLISSHLLGEVQAICNRVGILQEGVLKVEGQVSELLASQARRQTVVEVDAEDAKMLEAALGQIDGARHVGPGAKGRVRVELTELTVADLNRSLVQADISVTALVPEQGNLEDVFLEATR